MLKIILDCDDVLYSTNELNGEQSQENWIAGWNISRFQNSYES